MRNMDQTLKELLTHAFKQKASDIHLTTGKHPIFRIHGALVMQRDRGPYSAADTERMVKAMVSDTEYLELQKNRELDFAANIQGVSRFRVNAFYQMGKLSYAFRIIPNEIPAMADLNLPPIIQKLTKYHKGLVLVTGPTGSGKSTTLASMIKHINHTSRKHIITLEDPIEYVHKSMHSLIDQREVGVDTMSFANGLRASLRQDPDIILVGELRDLETIATAITAAETGHLVLGTLHTSSAISTIERIIDMFPAAQQNQVRSQLSTALKAVVAQQLLPTRDGTGRRAATEVLVNTPAVKNLINTSRTSQLQNVLQTSRSEGMHTMESQLQELVATGVIAKEDAQRFMTH